MSETTEVTQISITEDQAKMLIAYDERVRVALDLRAVVEQTILAGYNLKGKTTAGIEQTEDGIFLKLR